MANDKFRIIDVRHPSISYDSAFWPDWRECYEGGYYYVEQKLKKFSERESDTDYYNRMAITPTPTYAKAAVNDIRNAIFQRMRDIIRKDGSSTYKKAVAGEAGGVDMRGTSMNAFIGIDVLTELLVMGKVGVFIDAPRSQGETLADVNGARPYLYSYKVEDILSWTCTKPETPMEYQALLLRDKGLDYASHDIEAIELPSGEYERYRLLWVDKDDGFVRVQFYDHEGNPIDADGNEQLVEEPMTLALRHIPFVMFDIDDSLLKDVVNHQSALLNLTSSDVAYALKANFPFYTEQQDMRAVGDHLKHGVNPDGTATSGGQGAMSREMKVGPTHGRLYDLRSERPGFIHPSPEPLEASLKLQEKLEDDIRKLVNVAVQNKIGRRVTSAEAIKMSDQGLEAGLSYIGLILEGGERKITNHWAAYEERQVKKREIATIKYPDRYSLKTDTDRIEEASKLSELMFTVPGITVKKELAKDIVTSLLGGKIDVEAMDHIFAEIDKADYTTSDPDVIISAKEAGLVGEQTASMALGFTEDEYLQARKDHADRAARILLAQTSVKQAGEGTKTDIEKAGARGVEDISAEPAQEGRAERTQATDTTLKETTKKPQRGEAQ
jgi:hypothetical protein